MQFRGEYAFLSNFYSSKVVHVESTEPYRQLVFPSVEHYYQAMKSTSFEDQMAISQASSPAEAKRMGRKINIRPNWEHIKVQVMKNGVWQKFKDKSLANKLISTHPQEITEENTWGDTFWGTCNGHGTNVLGQILMETRKALRFGLDALQVHTSTYRYQGTDRLDITMKGQHPLGRLFAPTKEMVYGYKSKRIPQKEYTDMYYTMMIDSYRRYTHVWNYILLLPTVTFVCFCKPGDFCHRLLLADYFQQLGANYVGERM